MWFDALFEHTDTRRTVLRSRERLILRMLELFCGITSRYFGYFPTTRRQITVVVPNLNSAVFASNEISTVSMSFPIVDLRIDAGFL